jgi:ATP-dependent Clp protease ATP-binding subunit ClpX
MFFSFENVDLKFTDTALKLIAKEALKRGTGARGLRAIIEDIMLDIMYEIPSQNDIRECLITENVVRKKEQPIIVLNNVEKTA